MMNCPGKRIVGNTTVRIMVDGIIMNELYGNLMALCEGTEAFYFQDFLHNGDTYRIFNYRLATYSDFLLPGARECRGHTFRIPPGLQPVLVSLPMEKFFNIGENPMTMDLDFSRVVRVDDKRDGSLISTVWTGDGFILKSKGSLNSTQARDATNFLNSKPVLLNEVADLVNAGYTVNFEYTSRENRIVIGYDKPELRVLNVRENRTGKYLQLEDTRFTEEEWVDMYPVKVDDQWIEEAYNIVGREGYVLWFDDGEKVKLKAHAYVSLHKAKEAITNPRRLFEAVIMETSDDLKTMFLHDDIALMEIEAMEIKGKTLYNHLHKIVSEFYHANKELDRKEYAIKGQEVLKRDGVFSLAMNLYVGRDMGLKEHLLKNFKSYGIVDSASESIND